MPGTDLKPAPPLVVHVIHHLVMGGMENGLVNLINRMPVGAYRHAIACVEDYSEFRARLTRSDVDVIALHRSQIGQWGLRRRLFQLFRALRPAIVHSRNQSGLDALLPARLAGVRHCIHGEHGWDVDNVDGSNRRQALLRRLHSPLVDRYVAVSRDLERFLVQRVGVDPRRITQIYNGVDLQRFQPGDSGARRALPPEIWTAGQIWIGTVGRIQPIKDQATLLRAVAVALAARPELRRLLRVAVIGNGPLLEELRALAGTLGIAALVWFAGSREDVAALLPALDVFVLSSLNEGISNTILEAMACGVAIAATAVGGNIELVQDGVTGRFFTPRDSQELAQILLGYAMDEALRRRHGRAARERAVTRFDLQSMVSAYGAIYDEVCGART